ncbi:MAG: hypothetical protein IJ506_07625 [Clostridia bacterium]|nr:hypothetical protein [Clostridia bacterium]
MVCKQCGTEVPKGKYVCPKCLSHVVALQQSEKLAQIKAKQKRTVQDIFKSPIFLAYTIVLTAIAFLCTGNTIFSIDFSAFSKIKISHTGDLIVLFIYALFIIPPIVSATASWKLFLHKKTFNGMNIQSLKKYPSFYRKVFKIIQVLLTIIFVFIMVLVIVLTITAAKMSNEISQFGADAGSYGFGGVEAVAGSLAGLLNAGIAFMIIIPIVVFVILFICLHFFKNTYEKINVYFEKLFNFYASGEFHVNEQLSNVRLYVLAGLFLSLGIASYTGPFSGIGIYCICNGLYLILSALFFEYSEKTQKANILKFKEEHAKMVEINKQTSLEKAELNRIQREKEREIELEKQRKKEEEERKAQQAQQKQQELMQQMMNQWLAQNIGKSPQNPTNKT